MKRVVTTITFLSILLYACVEELTDKIDLIEGSTWNPMITVPLAYGEFSMSDLAEQVSEKNMEIGSNEEGITTFTYLEPNIFSVNATQYFSITDQNFSTFTEAIGELPATDQSTLIENSQSYSFEINSPAGDQLYEAILNGGSLDIDINGDLPFSGSVNIVFESIEKNGESLTMDYSWTTEGIQTHSQTIDMKEAILQLRGHDDSQSNLFNVTITTSVLHDGSAITSAQGIQVDMTLIDLQFERILANFAFRDISPDGSYFDVDFTKEMSFGSYQLHEPQIQFVLHNSFGAPVSIEVDQVISQSDKQSPLPLSGSMVKVPIAIGYPDIFGQSTQTQIDINHSNSNIVDLISYQPDEIYYVLKGAINPLSDESEHFIIDSANISADMLLEIPLYGYLKDVVLRDNYDFDGASFEDVEQSTITLSAINGLPLDAHIQAYFIDQYEEVVDSLLYDTTHIFPSATTDSDGYAIESNESDIQISIDKERIAKIATANTILLVTTLNTPESPDKSVRFREENKINIKLSGQSSLSIEL